MQSQLWFIVLSLIGCCCVPTAVSAQTTNRTYSLLQNSRNNITFVPYTAAQRVTIAKSLQNMFSIYVNREKKIKDYDLEYKKFSGQTIDPVPRVGAMVKNAASMKDKDFHYAFADIFASLRDLHTNYLMPAPHACYGFVQAVGFTVAAVKPPWYNSSKQELVVQQFATQPEINQLSYPQITKMSIGDIVLKINGKTFTQYVDSVKWATGGNNEAGAIRRAIAYLSARRGILMKVPAGNQVIYEMQSYNDPSRKYTVTLPWIASRNDVCFNKYLTFQANISNPSFSKSSTLLKRVTTPLDQPNAVEINRKIKENLRSMKLFHLDLYKEVFPLNPADANVVFTPTSDPILKWAIYDPKNMGILQISSFVYVL